MDLVLDPDLAVAGAPSAAFRLATRQVAPGPGRLRLRQNLHHLRGRYRSVEALLARTGACKRFVADRAYDADALRQRLRDKGLEPVIPGKRKRIVMIRHDKEADKRRWRVEATIGRLGGFRRVATRYDKPARTFRDAIALATIHMF
jgi:transposase